MKRQLNIMLCCCAALLSSSVFANDAKIPTAATATQLISEGDSVAPNAVSDDQIAAGERLYKQRCGGCHSLDRNRIGPRHRGVYGRKAGSVGDFSYSEALQNLDVVWTESTLDKWLENPTAFANGTSMGFRLRKADERKAVIAYLKSLSDTAESRGKK